MKSILANSFLSIILIWLILGCKEDAIVNTDIKDYTSDFDSIWAKFDEKYPLFEYKKVDWDFVYQQYRVQFKLITQEERDNNFIEMFKLFKDAHIYLKNQSQEILGQYIPKNFSVNFNEHFLTGFMNSLDWHKESDYWGWANVNNVGYIRITDLHIGSMDINNFDNAMDSLKLTNGIIIDLRNLRGGNLNLSEDVWNRFTDYKDTVGYQLYRNGPGHNDYAETIPVVTNPRDNWQYTKIVVVLIGQLSFSVGEIFAETMSHFPYVTLIGDTTFGGVEAPVTYKLPDGLEYSVPVVAYLNSIKEPLEWKGVIPDIYFSPEESVNNSNRDIVLEEAFNIITQNAYNLYLSFKVKRK